MQVMSTTDSISSRVQVGKIQQGALCEGQVCKGNIRRSVQGGYSTHVAAGWTCAKRVYACFLASADIEEAGIPVLCLAGVAALVKHHATWKIQGLGAGKGLKSLDRLWSACALLAHLTPTLSAAGTGTESALSSRFRSVQRRDLTSQGGTARQHCHGPGKGTTSC